VDGGEEVGGIGGFSGLFRPFLAGYSDPILVSSTDGVGTKLLLALEYEKLDGVGQDLVAMVVNDLVVTGARPLFFLDYIATGKLDPAQVETIIRSIQAACVESDCLLAGGETAEMPGMYAPGHTDLAGFGVGIVDRGKVIDGSGVKSGDAVLALGSSGFHSNGFSLIRKLIELRKLHLYDIGHGPNEASIDTLLKPTRLYVRPLLALYSMLGVGAKGAVKSVAHITGGGITENLARVIPKNLSAEIKRSSWEEPPVFRQVQEAAGLPDDEMDRTFNRGLGMVIVVDRAQSEEAKTLLEGLGERVYEIGAITERSPDAPPVYVG
jgi:phosphoribosylformylglycinamidine cyclo-ligase